MKKLLTVRLSGRPVAWTALLTSLLMIASLGLSGCLKSRAQLKQDGDDDQPAKPISQPVQDVQPQGGYALDEMKAEIARLTGRIDDLEHQKQDAANSAASSSASKDDLKALDKRVGELEQAQVNMLEAIKKLQDQGTLAASDPADLLDKAKTQIEAKSYEPAIETLNAYLKNPGAKNTQEATFLRGECYYNLQQYKKAIVDYSKFPEKYTKSSFMPAALYKIGQSFEQLGMKDDARGFYQELADKFPKSPEAKRVRSKLK